jgi:hypothetical protein
MSESLNQDVLRSMLPANRDDSAAIKRLASMGYPAIAPVLPALFEWLKTNGSPVEIEVRALFAQLGEPSIDLVRSALNAKHELCKCTVLKHVVWAWPRLLVVRLRPELERLVQHYSYYETDVLALVLLQQHGISDATWVDEWLRCKSDRLEHQLSLLKACGRPLSSPKST